MNKPLEASQPNTGILYALFKVLNPTFKVPIASCFQANLCQTFTETAQKCPFLKKELALANPVNSIWMQAGGSTCSF